MLLLLLLLLLLLVLLLLVLLLLWVGRLDEVHPSWSSLASRPQDSPLSATGVQQAR